MGFLVSIGLVVLGAALTALGFVRARGPWARYQALKAEDANTARYEAWRGGLRDSGTTGASVAMTVLRKTPPGRRTMRRPGECGATYASDVWLRKTVP